LERHGAARIVRRVTRRAAISKQVNPHTTMRYDRTRTSLDRHATYIAGAAR
jgi:hypothetical protein